MTAIAATATVNAFTPALAPRAIGEPVAWPGAPADTAPVAPVASVASVAVAPSRAAIAPRLAQRYRGRRVLAFVLSGLAGLGVLSLGALTSQIVGALDLAHLSSGDRQVAGVMLRLAPFAMLGGFAQVLSALAVLRDRPRAMSLGLTMALVGVASAAVAIFAIRVGVTPSAVTGVASSPSTDLVNLLAWTLGLDVLAALTIRGIIRGRETA